MNKDKYKFLYHVALAILSLAPSEAAGIFDIHTFLLSILFIESFTYLLVNVNVYYIVERSFSKQGFIHSDRRNRCVDEPIEAQMMISFNDKALSDVDNSILYE